MQMRPEVQIASVIKTMTDVIIPAIDPANRLAIEQSQLIIGLLSLLNTQLPLQFRFDRDELGRLLASAETLKATPANDPGTRAALDKLAVISATACTILDRCTLDPVLLTQSVRDMRAAMGSVVVAAAGTADLDTQLRVEKIILNMSKDQLLRDRSLMKMQGWEADPAALPDIEDLLGATLTCDHLQATAAGAFIFDRHREGPEDGFPLHPTVSDVDDNLPIGA